jgi:hypothetical protein
VGGHVRVVDVGVVGVVGGFVGDHNELDGHGGAEGLGHHVAVD